MGQFRFILWLAYWYLQSDSFEFEWDSGNTLKSAQKHGVDTEEVESLFDLRLGVPLGRQVSPPTDEERLCLVGPSARGKVTPISSRMASRKERKLYEEIRKITQRI